MSREARAIRRRIERNGRQAVRRALKRRGCTCQPVIRPTGWTEFVPRFEAFHDPWCAALRAEEGPGPHERNEVLLEWNPELAALQLQLADRKRAA